MPVAVRAGRRLGFEVDGEGPTLVLVPGIGSGRKLFGTLPRRFARAGFRCVTFDPVGVPPSSAHEDDHGYDFGVAADDLWTVISESGAERAWLVGTSLGGKVSLAAAARRPDRCLGLALLASAAVVPARARRVYRYFEAVAARIDGDDFGALVAPFLFGSTFQATRPQLVDDIVRGLRPGPEVRRLMIAQARGLQEFDGQELARAWQGPTLCIAGGEDTLTPAAEVRATAALWPSARYVEIADAGHSLLLESARVFDEVVTFAGST
ncbi:MAG: alpha/beta hydrolase [Planctomycetota bacterium]